MIIELLLRWVHVIGACVLLGTGAGIAFFMLMAYRSKSAEIIAHTASVVVIADYVFTTTAVIAQPISGIALAHVLGWDLRESWLVVSIGLYVLTGLFWLPVVWIQIQLKAMAQHSVEMNSPLPDRFHRMFLIWFFCGFPAFFSVLAIVWLMIARPTLF